MSIFVGSKRALLRPRPAAAGGGGTWTEVWSETYTINDTGWNGFTLVDVFAIGEFSQTGGTQMRVTLKGPPTGTEGTYISAMYVYDGSGTEDWDFGGTPTQLQYAGSNTFTVPNNSTLLLDAVNFGKAASGNLVFAWNMTQGANDDLARGLSGNMAVNSKSYYKSGVDAATVDKTGYSNNSGTGHKLITKIELLL